MLNSSTITGYLPDDLGYVHRRVADKWKKNGEISNNCTITVEVQLHEHMRRRETDCRVILHGTQYDD